MKSEITELNVTQTSRTLALVVAILTVFIAVIGIMTLAASAQTDVTFKFIIPITVTDTASAFLLYLFLPFYTLAATYILVAAFCIAYNLVAKYTGGITFHTKPQ